MNQPHGTPNKKLGTPANRTVRQQRIKKRRGGAAITSRNYDVALQGGAFDSSSVHLRLAAVVLLPRVCVGDRSSTGSFSEPLGRCGDRRRVDKRDGYPYDYHRQLYTFRVKSRTQEFGIYRPRHRWSFSPNVTFKSRG